MSTHILYPAAILAMILVCARCAMIPEPVMTKTQMKQTQAQAKYLGGGWVKR